jgi:hypothetical protein
MHSIEVFGIAKVVRATRTECGSDILLRKWKG